MVEKNGKSVGKKSGTNEILAILFVSAAFLMIGIMLVIQNSTTSEIRDDIKLIANGTLTSNNTAKLISGLQDTAKSNQDAFNILIPVFAAWITTIVAFYFNSKSQEQSQDTIKQLSSKISNPRPDMLLSELMLHYPGSDKAPHTITPDDSLDADETKEIFRKYGNVVVADKKAGGDPLGILLLKDCFELKGPLKNNYKNIVDSITGRQWSDEGPGNFAELTRDDLVSEAIRKMNKIKQQSAPDSRGLVFHNGKMVGIINYEMLTRPFEA